MFLLSIEDRVPLCVITECGPYGTHLSLRSFPALPCRAFLCRRYAAEAVILCHGFEHDRSRHQPLIPQDKFSAAPYGARLRLYVFPRADALAKVGVAAGRLGSRSADRCALISSRP
jgi:hypothetical protein